MITKKYIASDMQEALAQIKEEMGTDAVIVSSRVVPTRKGLFGLFSKKAVEVVATYDERKKTEESRFQKQKNGRTAYIPKKQNQTMSYNVPTEMPTVTANSAAAAYGSPFRVQPTAPAQSMQQSASKPTAAVDSQLDEMKRMLKDVAGKVEDMSRGRVTTGDQLSEEAVLYSKILEDHDVDPGVARSVCAKAQEISLRKGAPIKEVLETLVTEQLGEAQPIKITKFQQKIIMVIGATGVGKTTTLVKLASDIIVNNGLKVGVINSDVFRVAAQDHLKMYCDILGCEMVTVYKPEELPDAIEALSECDVIFLDTAGKVSHDEAYRNEIAQMISYGKIDDIFLTISASTNQKVMKDTLANYAFLQKHRILLTKMDEASTLGVLLNIKMYTDRPLSYMTTGQAVPDDIEKVDVQAVARSLME